MIRYPLILGLCLVLTSCRNANVPTAVAVSAQGVRLVSFQFQSGETTQVHLQDGMQKVAEEVSTAYAVLNKTYPKLSGNLRGTLRIKPDGTILSFTDIHSEFTPILPQKTFSDFVAASFRPNCRFPEGERGFTLLIDFWLEPPKG